MDADLLAYKVASLERNVFSLQEQAWKSLKEIERLREMERHWRELYFQASRVPATPQTPALTPSEAARR